MKKIAIAITAALVLSMAMPAFAVQVTMKDGRMAGGYTIYNNRFNAMNPAATASISLATSASEAGGWSATAELGNLIGTPALSRYKVEFQDPLFRLTAFGKGYSAGDKNDPFAFVKSNGTHSGTLKVRTTVGPVVADIEDSGNLYVFGEKALNGSTLGLAGHRNLVAPNPTTVVGYGKTNVSSVALTGAVGMTLQPDVADQNIGYGVKAEMPVLPTLKAAVTVKSEPANFINRRNLNTLKVEAAHEVDLIKVNGAYTHTANANDGALRANVIEGTANWRGSKSNQAWDNQFAADKYFKNVAPAIQGNVKLTEDNTQPTTELTVKGTMPVIPSRMWVNASLYNRMDEDSAAANVRNLANTANINLAGTSQMKLQADAYVKATDKLSIEPGMTYVSMNQGANYLKLGSKAGYQVAPNGKLTAEYAHDFVQSVSNDSKLGFGYEVKF